MDAAAGTYISWLEQKGAALFNGGGTSWALYHGALVPASPFPAYYELDRHEARSLLKASGAWFIRYSASPCDHETSWWFVVCDRYDPASVNAKTRSEIRRGRRECTVEQIDAEWLAANGYPCYYAAFRRYRRQTPLSEDGFKGLILGTIGGPFSYWGVFCAGRLAGYCQCIIEGRQAATNIAKYHPDYLRHRSAYALNDELIQKYVVGEGMVLNNGNRSVAHDTNYQDVLMKLGFRRQFCRMDLVYAPRLGIGMNVLFPLRPLLARLPEWDIVQKITALMRQEQIRREFSK